MGANWTLEDPGAGSPSDIRAESSRQSAAAQRFREVAAEIRATRVDLQHAWQGAAAGAADTRVEEYAQACEHFAAQCESDAATLARYAAEVDDIKFAAAGLAGRQTEAQHQLRHARSLGIDAGGDVSALARWGAMEAGLERELARISVAWQELAHRRQSADTAAIRAFTSAASRGNFAGVAIEFGPGMSLRRSAPLPSLGQLAQLTELELLTLFAMQPDLADALAAASDPDDVARWWSALTVEQRTALVLGAPALMGQLGGVSPLSRVAANRLNAAQALRALDERIAAVPRLADAEGNRITARRRYLEDAVEGRVQLYLYRPTDQSIIEMIGRPDARTRDVVVYVPGTYTSVHSFYAVSAQQVGRWLNGTDDRVVSFVWKEGHFPGEQASDGSSDPWRIVEANVGQTALDTGERLAGFQREIAASSPFVRDADQIGIGHSWGLAAVTASEVAGARFDQVHSLAGAGMPAEWVAASDTRYYHWSYIDALSIAQETGTVWSGRNPGSSPEFSSHILHRQGDFSLAVPRPPGGGAVAPVVVPVTINPIDNHNLIATDDRENVQALRRVLDAVAR